MEEIKLNLIADNLHYPIEVSAIEKKIISTQIFNRLHNILQNSTVYLTYPSNRTTRFIHSLGCMFIAGQIFQNGINNASVEDKKKFFEIIESEIAKIQSNSEFKMRVRQFIKNNTRINKVICELPSIINDPLYYSSMPGNLTENNYDREANISEDKLILKNQKLLYIIAFQSLRLHALMHDIGHPPFSHVTENALGDIRDYLSKKDSNNQTDNEKKFLENFNEVLKGGKFHEKLGNQLENELLKYLTLDSSSPGSNIEKAQYYFCLLIEYFTKGIIEARGNPLFECISSIVSSDLDADRLDYVSRDLFNSGLISHTLNYGRLLKSYQLYFRNIKIGFENISKPSFLPSVRALSNIEEFYRLRFDLYKYVIFHHRVLKTDGLLRKVIYKLALKNLETENHEDSLHQSIMLPENISGLWKVMDDKYFLPDDIVHNFIQWDDSWLLSLLRKTYLELEERQEKISSEENNSSLDKDEKILKIQLEEIISNRKFYYSLHKRVDTYIPIDNSFLNSVPAKYSWDIIETIYNNIAKQNNGDDEIVFATAHKERIIRLSNYFDEYSSAIKSESFSTIDKLRESWGFFTTILFTTLNQLLIFDVNGIVNDAINDFKQKFELDDVLYIDKHISPGVKSNLPLLVEGVDAKDIPIGSVSRIADDLNRSSSLFPPFFIFTYKEIDNDKLDIEKMRIEFGSFLWESFANWIKKNLGEVVNDK